MKILFLGGNVAKELADWLKKQGEDVICKEGNITLEDVNKVIPDFIVSYNYRYIIPKEILEFVNKKAINLHISYLPYNRGADPNLWSFLENTPKGVTIHNMDKGIDTGDIVVQKEVYIDEEKETLRSSYKILHREIQILFKENWNKIKNFVITHAPQKKGGSIHYKRDLKKIKSVINENSWDISIKEAKERYNKCTTNAKKFRY